MKTVVYDKKATPNKLVCCDVDKPEPNDNEVLVKIVVVSINATDYRSIKIGSIPKGRVFGSAIAGIVESVGKNVKQFKKGDYVVGDTSDNGFGGFSEYLSVPEEILVLKPLEVSFKEAAALPVAAITALQAVRNKAKITEGMKVLIVGSSGGVGIYAVQLAKYFGAKVTAVCSTRNVEQSFSLGADVVIDYKTENFKKHRGKYDLIMAINGSYSLSFYKRLLNPNGIYVMLGGSYLQIFSSILFGSLMSSGSKKMRTLAAKSSQEDLEYVLKLVEEGKVKALIEKEYAFENTAEAMRYVGKGHVSSKVVIIVDKEQAE